jgi:hypothetical protein
MGDKEYHNLYRFLIKIFWECIQCVGNAFSVLGQDKKRYWLTFYLERMCMKLNTYIQFHAMCLPHFGRTSNNAHDYTSQDQFKRSLELLEMVENSKT